MIDLDMRTEVTGDILVYFVGLFVAILLWRQDRGRIGGAAFWVLDFALQATAFVLIALRGTIPSWASILAANVFVVAGATAGFVGLERFTGKRGSRALSAAILLAFTLSQAYFTYLRPDQGARNLNAALGLFAVCLRCAWLALDGGRKKPQARGVGAVFVGYCALSLVRVAHYLTAGLQQGDYFHSGDFEVLVIIAYQGLVCLLTCALALMFNGRFLSEARIEREKFSKAFQSSPYGLFLTRQSDGLIVEVNGGFSAITGFAAEEAIGRTVFELGLWELEGDRGRMLDELARRGYVRDRTLRFHDRTGKAVSCIFSASPLEIDGEPYLVSNIADVSERERAEAWLAQERALYKDLMDSQPAGIYRLRVRGEKEWREGAWREKVGTNYSVELASDRFCEISGISREEFEADPGIVPDRIHPDDAPSFAHNNVEALNALKPFVWEGRLVKRGETVWVHIESIPRRLEDGDLIWTGILYDISGRMETEEKIRRLNSSLELQVAERTRELRDSQLALLNLVDDLNRNGKDLTEANLALEAANKDLEAFSYSVAHDLRSPLRAISGFTSILQKDYASNLDGEGQRIASIISDNTQKMSRLIDDLLAFSRLGRAKITLSIIDMESMARSVFAELAGEEGSRRIAFRAEFPGTARGDAALMREVWANLLGNAIKYSSKKERPEIVASRERIGNEVVYSVRDNGAGFDMKYAHKLFGVFQRLHGQAEFEGTGVGLAIVQRIIQHHGGRVWAEGKVDEGAAFHFALPAE